MKDFLLICDKNCATYKEVFPLFKQGIVSFGSPVKEYEGTDRKFGNHGWITTFPVTNKKKLVLTQSYDPALYPKYDNYDAVEVSRIKNIPYDYDGTMGVPITIFDYDLDRVDIQGIANDNRIEQDWVIKGTPTHLDEKHKNFQGMVMDGKPKYARVLIKNNFEVIGLSASAGYDKDIVGIPLMKEGDARPLVDNKNRYARVLIKNNPLGR